MLRLFSRRSYAVIAASIVMLVAASGCAGVIPAPGTGSPEPSPLPLTSSALVGTWSVAGTDTLADGSEATFGADGRSLSVVSDCVTLYGSWAANSDGLFLAAVEGWSDSCPASSAPASASASASASADDASSSPNPQLTAWLTSSAQFTHTTEGITLYTSSGQLAAQLTSADSGGSSSVSASPDAVAPSPLPDGIIAAKTSGLIGTWVQVGRPQKAPTPPFISFSDDGTWTGSDGCNGQGGRWLAGQDGAFLATVGPQTLMACEGMENLGRYLDMTYRAGFRGTDLVLFDATGKELITLVTEKEGE